MSLAIVGERDGQRNRTNGEFVHGEEMSDDCMRNKTIDDRRHCTIEYPDRGECEEDSRSFVRSPLPLIILFLR